MFVRLGGLPPGTRFHTLATKAAGEVQSEHLALKFVDDPGVLVRLRYGTGSIKTRRLHPCVRVEVVVGD